MFDSPDFEQNQKNTPSSNSESKKQFNKNTLIKYMYRQGSLSIPEMSRLTQSSTPTVSILINELKDEGLIQESGIGMSSGGRRPNLYSLVANSRYVLSVIMGRYTTRMGLYNFANESVTEVIEFSLLLNNDIKSIDILVNYAEELILSSGIDRRKIIGVGIAMPGLINSRKGVNHSFLNFNGENLRDLLQRRFNLNVYLENDASIMALGEHTFGLGKGIENVLCVYVGWGVGMGIILNGRLYHGRSGFAGEFGHVQVVEDGELCYCGKCGCLTTVASASALAKLAQQGIKEGKITNLKFMVNDQLEKLEAGLVVKAAQQGDQYAIVILEQVGYKLGQSLATLIHLFNPELIILGGRLSKAGHFLTDPIQQALNKYCISRLREDVNIKITQLSDKAGFMGTVALVVDNYFVNTI